MVRCFIFDIDICHLDIIKYVIGPKVDVKV